MSTLPLDVLVLTDLHYTAHARHFCPLEERQSSLAPIMVNKVMLSLSGHFHWGQELTALNGVRYATTPALTQESFSFQHLRLEGRDCQLTTHRLKLPVEGLADLHSHTEAGAKISLGSDSHAIEEIADFHQHLALLQEAGLELEEIAGRLYNPFISEEQ